MANISIKRDHNLGQDEAQKRIRQMEPKLKEKYGVSLDWSSDEDASISGKGVSGNVKVDSSKLNINLKLGILLKPMEGKIRESLQRQVDKALT